MTKRSRGRGEERPPRWLIAYDISDERRLVRVHRWLSRRAAAVQYSVFTARLTAVELHSMKQGLAKLIDPKEDDVRFYLWPERQAEKGALSGRLPSGVFLLEDGKKDDK
jgi:CRISPR-associated protein Cas2